MSEPIEGLKLLRWPFPDHMVGKLPKPTKAQTDEVKANYQAGKRCALCGSWHHPAVVHLDYVGHAATTDRLLDADPMWTWEPLAYTAQGLPQFDETGGLWIKLTVCGVTRIGYGNAAAKAGDPGNYEKEVIGDAIRNAAMRFGVALELWHKGELHKAEPQEDGDDEGAADWLAIIKTATTLEQLREIKTQIGAANLGGAARASIVAAWNARKAEIAP